MKTTNTKTNRKPNAEVWKDVRGLEGKYQVSSLGNVRSLNYKQMGFVKNLKPSLNPQTGYLAVNLRKHDGSGWTITIHRLVAETFIPNPKNLEQVGHKDDDRTNNRLENLYWTSRDENNARDNARRMKSTNAAHTARSHLFVKATKDGEVRYFKNARRAAQGLGCSHVLVIKVLRNENHTALGWKLEYIDRKDKEFEKSGLDPLTPSQRREVEGKERMRSRKLWLHTKMVELSMDYYTSVISKDIAMKRMKEIRRSLHTVLQCDKEGNIIREWKNAHTAEKELGISGVYDSLRGTTKTAGGYIWKYKVA